MMRHLRPATTIGVCARLTVDSRELRSSPSHKCTGTPAYKLYRRLVGRRFATSRDHAVQDIRVPLAFFKPVAAAAAPHFMHVR